MARVDAKILESAVTTQASELRRRELQVTAPVSV
jgi:hypothetical protein